MTLRVMLSAVLSLILLTAAAMPQQLPDQYREPFAKSWPIREETAPADEGATWTASLHASARSPRLGSLLDFSSVEAYERSLEPIRDSSEESRRDGRPQRPSRIRHRGSSWSRRTRPPTSTACGPKYSRASRPTPSTWSPAVWSARRPSSSPSTAAAGAPRRFATWTRASTIARLDLEAVKRGYIVYAPGILMAVSYADPPDPRIEGADYKALEKQASELGTSTRSLQMYPDHRRSEGGRQSATRSRRRPHWHDRPFDGRAAIR